ncbi:MAG: sigma-70 family RNA polymerase sigma factor [Bifidobacteriaceae bacterium]|jgi:RNA polymerase sigma-70 factor (ECF subfamily)|nr:sigma-70 family RNA polymerase sigma factor [Bifidobacteriaceae bacterium]
MPSATAEAAPRAQPTRSIEPVRAASTDRSRWAEIAERHYRDVYRLAYRLTGHTADAEDLTQETFVRVFRSLESYRPEGSFEGWLHRITTNLFLDSKRREARIRMDGLGEEAQEVADPDSTPDRLIESMSLGTRLDEALAALSPDLREALVMCDVEGKSYQEIADALGVRLGTVRSRLHRARAQARCVMTG